MTTITRRNTPCDLGGLVAGVGLAPGVATGLAPATASEGAAHPDAPLVAAFEGYRAACLALRNDPVDLPTEFEAQLAAMGALLDPHMKVLENRPAMTGIGTAIKLRYVFSEFIQTTDAEDVAFDGAPVSAALAAELEGDSLIRMLFNMMQDATKAAGLTIGGESR